jgi:GT2 family glycosyltransferase
MNIFIVILNFNGKALTIGCLSSLAKLDRGVHTITALVVDNASTDGSVEEIKQQFPELTVLTNSENLGFSEGNNIGIRYALKQNADFIFLLNNDTTVSSDCILELLKAADQNPNGGIFGPKIYFTSGKEFHLDRYQVHERGHVIWYAGGKIDWANVYASHRGVDEVDQGQYDELARTHFVSGCAMFVRRSVFEKIGLFDPKVYLYFEDVDFSRRAELKKFELYYVPTARLWHDNAGSSGGSGSDLQNYYITRNRLLIGLRYAPWKTKLALFREATRMLMKGDKTQREAVGDFLRKKYGRRNSK